MAHLHPARVQRLQKLHVRNGTRAATTKRWGSYSFDFNPIPAFGTGLGDTERLIQGDGISRNRNWCLQGIGRRGTVVNTDQGQRETVEPVTYTGTSEGTGNRIRADEREWIQPVP